MQNIINITDINQEYLHTHSAIPFTLNRFIKKGKEVYSWNTASRFFPEEMKDAPIRIKYLMDNLKEVGLDDIAMPDQPKDDKLVEKCHEITFDEFCKYYESDEYKSQGTIWNIEKNYTAIFMTKETHDKIKEKYNRSVSLVYPAADCAVVRYYDNKKEVIGLTHSDGYYTGRNIVNDMTKYMKEHFNSNLNDIKVFVGASSRDNWIYEGNRPDWAINKDENGNFISYIGDWEKYIDELPDNKYEIHYGDYLYSQLIESGINEKNISYDPNNTLFNKDYYSNSRNKKLNEKNGRNLMGITFDKEIVNKVEDTEIKLR